MEISFAEVGNGSVVLNEDVDLRAAGLLLPSFSSLSEDCASLLSLLDLLQSKAVPGVFGVLLALPKLANAPLPRPKAEDAPELVGDVTEALVVEMVELNGLFRLVRLPNRLDDEEEEVSWLSRLSLRSDLFVDRLSLLLLLIIY